MYLFQWYILKSLFFTTLGIDAILTGIIWLTQSLRFWKVLAYQGLPFREVAYLLIYLLPNIILVTFPIGFLIAVLWRYVRLMQDNELIVIRNCGVKAWFLAKPCFVLGGLFSAMLFFFSLYLAPRTLHTMKEKEHYLRDYLTPAVISPGLFLEINGRMLYVHSQQGPSLFRGIIIHDARHPQKQETITGQHAHIIQHDKGLRIVIHEGTHQQIPHLPDKAPSLLKFKQYTLSLNPSKSSQRPRKLQEQTIDTLIHDLNKPPLRQSILKEIQQRILFPLLPIIYGAWACFVLLYQPFQRRRTYGFILLILGGVALLQVCLLSGLHPTMPEEVLYITYGLCIFPLLLWWGTYMLEELRGNS